MKSPNALHGIRHRTLFKQRQANKMGWDTVSWVAVLLSK